MRSLTKKRIPELIRVSSRQKKSGNDTICKQSTHQRSPEVIKKPHYDSYQFINFVHIIFKASFIFLFVINKFLSSHSSQFSFIVFPSYSSLPFLPAVFFFAANALAAPPINAPIRWRKEKMVKKLLLTEKKTYKNSPR